MKLGLNKNIVTFAAYILCGTFCLSAVAKIIYWTDTKLSLEKLLRDEYMAIFVAILIILIELIITATIFSINLWRFTGIFSSIILIIFTSVALWGKMVGRINDCPCFGNLFGAEIGLIFILRNMFLMFMCFILLNSNKLIIKKIK